MILIYERPMDHIPYEKIGRTPKPVHPVRNEEQLYRQLEERCIRVLVDYLNLLRKWAADYVPQPEDETWHPLFTEALQKKDHIEYWLDVLLLEPSAERAALIREYGGEVRRIEQRLSELCNRSCGRP